MFSLRSRKLKPKDPSMDEILSSIRSMVENEEQSVCSEPPLSVLEKSTSSDLSVKKDDSAEIFDLTEALEEKSTVVREAEGEELTMLQEGEDKKTKKYCSLILISILLINIHSLIFQQKRPCITI